VATKRDKKTQRIIEIKVRCLVVDGAEARLVRAIDLLLKSAAMNTNKFQDNHDSRKEELSYQGTDKSRQQNITRE